MFFKPIRSFTHHISLDMKAPLLGMRWNGQRFQYAEEMKLFK